jgi:hypothetical protein
MFSQNVNYFGFLFFKGQIALVHPDVLDIFQEFVPERNNGHEFMSMQILL